MSEGRMYGRPVNEWCTPPVVRARSFKTDPEGINNGSVGMSSPHSIAHVHDPVGRSVTTMATSSPGLTQRSYTSGSQWLPPSSLHSAYSMNDAMSQQHKRKSQVMLTQGDCKSSAFNKPQEVYTPSIEPDTGAEYPENTLNQISHIPSSFALHHGRHHSGHLGSVTEANSSKLYESQQESLSHGLTTLRVSTSKSANNSAHVKLTPTAKVAPLMEARKSTTKPVSLQSQKDICSLSGGQEKEHKVSPKFTFLSLDPPQDSYSGDVLGTVDKWKVLIETKDRILAQKDDLIKRQRQSLSYLKDQVKEWESQYHQLLSSKAHIEGGSAFNAQLKELEYSNSSLKAEFSESLVAKNSEVNKLSKKLDELEYQRHKSIVEHSNRAKQYDNEIESLKAQVKNKDASLEELKGSLSEALSKNDKLTQHISQLNEYLGGMPTMEEHHALLEQAQELGVKCEVLTAKLVDCEERLEMSSALLKQKEEEGKSLAAKITEIGYKLQQSRLELNSQSQHDVSIQEEKRKLAVECQRLQKLLFESESRCRRELQAMRDRHKQRFLEATSELRSRHKVVAKRAKVLEMQLIKNSDAMTALNSELRVSQGTIGELKSSIREVLCENQKLVEKNITLQEASSEEANSATSLSESQSSTTLQLASELSHCIGDIESLVQLSSSFFEGRNPTTSVHIGVAGSPYDSHATDYDESEDSSSSDEEKLRHIRQLQAKVDKLREMVSDQFATQVCTNCQVQ